MKVDGIIEFPVTIHWSSSNLKYYLLVPSKGIFLSTLYGIDSKDSHLLDMILKALNQAQFCILNDEGPTHSNSRNHSCFVYVSWL